MTSRRKRAALTEEDKALWMHATRSVKPLIASPNVPAFSLPTALENKPSADPPALKASQKRDAQRRTPAKPVVPPLASLDRHERKKLARGKIAIEARIDLHGLRQAEAHEVLRKFLTLSHGRGHKLVMVITGKGRTDLLVPCGEDRGILRRLVPQWLAMADLRPIVLSFEEAGRSHGGAGALYIRLRRKPSKRDRFG